MLPYSLAVTSEPAIEPVSVDEAKRNCDEDGNSRDIDFASWITEARKKVERDCRRSLITQTLALKLDEWPSCDFIELHQPPAISVSSIQYTDTAGATQTWSSGWSLDADRIPGVVFLDYGESFPTTRTQRNAITVTYTAGYGTTAADVPTAAKSAIKLLVKQRYDEPESGAEPVGYGALISTLQWGFYP